MVVEVSTSCANLILILCRYNGEAGDGDVFNVADYLFL